MQTSLALLHTEAENIALHSQRPEAGAGSGNKCKERESLMKILNEEIPVKI